MFWKCEEKPEEWWSENDVIDICRVLLEDFMNRIETARLDDYFLRGLNKLDSLHEEIIRSIEPQNTTNLAMFREVGFSYVKISKTLEHLEEWFNRNYFTPVSLNEKQNEVNERPNSAVDSNFEKSGNTPVIPEIPTHFRF